MGPAGRDRGRAAVAGSGRRRGQAGSLERLPEGHYLRLLRVPSLLRRAELLCVAGSLGGERVGVLARLGDRVILRMR